MSIKEQEEAKKQYEENKNANIEAVSLIDNSKQIVDAKQENMQIQSENGIWLISGILFSILVLGVVIIRIIKKK